MRTLMHRSLPPKSYPNLLVPLMLTFLELVFQLGHNLVQVFYDLSGLQEKVTFCVLNQSEVKSVVYEKSSVEVLWQHEPLQQTMHVLDANDSNQSRVWLGASVGSAHAARSAALSPSAASPSCTQLDTSFKHGSYVSTCTALMYSCCCFPINSMYIWTNICHHHVLNPSLFRMENDYIPSVGLLQFSAEGCDVDLQTGLLLCYFLTECIALFKLD